MTGTTQTAGGWLSLRPQGAAETPAGGGLPAAAGRGVSPQPQPTNNAMRTNTTILLGAAALLLVSCADTRSELPAPAAMPAIGFRPEVETRAARTQLGAGDEFAVWASRTAGGVETPILTAEPVRHTSAGWVYANTQYWWPGSTYDFRALYPAGTPGVTFAGGYFAVADFDARQSTDLMVASVTGVGYAAGDPTPEAVCFDFRHLTARVVFEGRTSQQATALTLREALLYGLPATGSYDGAADTDGTGLEAWTPGPATTAADPFARSEGVTLNYGGETLFADDLLVVPQRLAGTTCVLELRYDDPGAASGVTVRRATIPADVVSAWEAGGSYRYTFSLDALNYILFDRPTVEAWNYLSGGSITIE